MTNMGRRHTAVVNVAQAKARLSELIRRASAGEEIIIARDHRPVARLAAVAPAGARRPGSARGRVAMAADFDATPKDFAEYVK